MSGLQSAEGVEARREEVVSLPVVVCTDGDKVAAVNSAVVNTMLAAGNSGDVLGISDPENMDGLLDATTSSSGDSGCLLNGSSGYEKWPLDTESDVAQMTLLNKQNSISSCATDQVDNVISDELTVQSINEVKGESSKTRLDTLGSVGESSKTRLDTLGSVGESSKTRLDTLSSVGESSNTRLDTLGSVVASSPISANDTAAALDTSAEHSVDAQPLQHRACGDTTSHSPSSPADDTTLPAAADKPSNVDTRETVDVPRDGSCSSNSSPRAAATKELLNPFFHRIAFRWPYDYIKVAVLGVLLMPLRVLGIIISLIMAFVFSTLGLWGVSREELSERPLTGWRGKMRWGMALSGRFMTRCYGFHVVSIKGEMASHEDAPILVVAPHSSFFDGVAVYWSKIPGLVSRSENLDIPLFGKYIDYTQPVYVWRDSTNSRQKTIQEIKHRATCGDNWPQVMVFPEGTCTNGSCLVTFKPGAFYPGVPVQPIIIRYRNSMDTTTWTWDGPGAMKLLLLTLCQFHNYCEIEYLPVYRPSEAEKKDAHLFAANVRQVMAKALGVPVVDYSYDDCRLMRVAKNNKLPVDTGLVEFQKLRQQLGFTLKEVEQCLSEQFTAMASKQDGKVRLKDFARYLGLSHTEPLVVHLFNLLDMSHKGEVSFRDYLFGYCEHVRPACSEATVLEAFAAVDTGVTPGKVTLEELQDRCQASPLLGLTQQEIEVIFKQADASGRGYLTVESFLEQSKRRPEYAWLFLSYRDSVRMGTRQTVSSRRQTEDKPKTE